jgi:lipid A 3-O-deacylase
MMRWVVTWMLLSLTFAPAVAADGDTPFGIDEVKFGAFIHDFDGGNDESDSVDINLELAFHELQLFQSDNAFLEYLATPRPHIGGTINADGETHTGYFGLSWQANFSQNVFFDLHLGGVGHTGPLHQQFNNEVSLGTRFMFREAFELGYRFGSNWSVSVQGGHMSNAGMDEDNDGMSWIGGRLGFRY